MSIFKIQDFKIIIDPFSTFEINFWSFSKILIRNI